MDLFFSGFIIGFLIMYLGRKIYIHSYISFPNYLLEVKNLLDIPEYSKRFKYFYDNDNNLDRNRIDFVMVAWPVIKKSLFNIQNTQSFTVNSAQGGGFFITSVSELINEIEDDLNMINKKYYKMHT